MEAITRLEKSGMTVSAIATATGIGPAAIRRWKRGEATPVGDNRQLITALAESRGLVLFAADFNKQPSDKAA